MAAKNASGVLKTLLLTFLTRPDSVREKILFFFQRWFLTDNVTALNKEEEKREKIPLMASPPTLIKIRLREGFQKLKQNLNFFQMGNPKVYIYWIFLMNQQQIKNRF